jgi:hypothetical protein
MVGLLVQAPRRALRPVWGSVLYAEGLVVGDTSLGRGREHVPGL